jgi:hypothetical protein
MDQLLEHACLHSGAGNGEREAASSQLLMIAVSEAAAIKIYNCIIQDDKNHRYD